ncbi:uncharacterized protein LOC124315570 [Daphnia pulicaria]|uniref:uncharacterized protein LOC124315570 n=1 Tax=Daphnia pulicaria TaxID=35523 RepID=UPI001EE9C590|nr:uncharacterized protein LOC124315570 [Daphnia pulicaria]
MSGDKNSSMDSTLPVPLPKSPREVVSSDDSDEDESIGTQEMSDTDETCEERSEHMRRCEEFFRNHDPTEMCNHHLEMFNRHLAKFQLELALEVSRLTADESFSLDGKLIPCPGNVVFDCMVGYYKESMSSCPFCDRMWTEIHDILTDPDKERETSLTRLMQTLSWRLEEGVGIAIILQSKEVMKSYDWSDQGGTWREHGETSPYPKRPKAVGGNAALWLASLENYRCLCSTCRGDVDE